MRRFLVFPFFIFFFLFFLCDKSFSLNFQDSLNPELISSTRALGMAHSFVSLTDDSTAPFYNPAGLGTTRSWQFHLSNLQLQFDQKIMSTVLNGGFTQAGQLGQMMSLTGNKEYLLSNPGEMLGQEMQFAPHFLTRYLSFGFLYRSRSRAALGTGANDLFEYAQRTDYGPYMGINISLFGGIIKFGATGFYLTRTETFGEQTKEESFSLNEENTKQGLALVGTAGFKFTLPIAFLPTIALSQHNALQQAFVATGADPEKNPSIIPSYTTAAFSLSPKLGDRIIWHLEVNLKDATNQDPTLTQQDKTTLGMELDFVRFIRLRAGWAHNTYSWGIGLTAKKLQFDLASYPLLLPKTGTFTETIDRKFVLSLSYGF